MNPKRIYRAENYPFIDESRIRTVLHAETRQPVVVKVEVRRRRRPERGPLVSLKAFARANGICKVRGRWTRVPS